MSHKTFFWRVCAIFLAISLSFPALSVRAQEGASVTIFPPDTTAYPQVSTLLDVFDDQGNFITNLTPTDVMILEDGEKITPTQLETLHPQLNFVIAINSGLALAVRDGFGLSRYDKMIAVLQNWAAARLPDNPDSLALVWNGGIIASQLSPAEWNTRLAGFDPGLRNSTAGLTALAFSLDVVQQNQAPPGGKKAILLVTPHLDNQDINALPDLVNRAIQSNTRVYVWLSDSKDYLTHPGALALQELATKTGGRYLTFTGSETLPDPEEWIASLRNVYRLTYNSLIRTEGQHNLNAQVSAGELSLSSNIQSFPLNIQPPSPVLLSPPIQIIRQNPEAPFDIENFPPTSQEISMLVEFPDGFERALVRTSLYVDGQLAGENRVEPFNSFTWDLIPYVATGEHTLQVEVVDDLGLSQKSAVVPVQVTVVQPPGGIAGLVLRNRVAFTVAVVVFAGLILLGILFFGGRKTFLVLAERRRMRAMRLDPVTQPVNTQGAAAQRANPFPWLRRKAPAPAGYLVKLTPDGQPSPGDPISLAGHELTFGTDPTQATNVLDHHSLSSLHARLRHSEDGSFTLVDQNSVAGTWVNYELIPKEGRFLRHGDVINFGQLTYRFVLTKPPAAQKPTIVPLSTDDSH